MVEPGGKADYLLPFMFPLCFSFRHSYQLVDSAKYMLGKAHVVLNPAKDITMQENTLMRLKIYQFCKPIPVLLPN